MRLVHLDEAAASVADTARLGLAAWLLGHGVPLATSVGPFGLPPLAVTLLAGWRVARAGVHTSRAIGASRRAPQETVVVAAAVGMAYGLLGALAAAVAEASGPAGSPLRAGGTLAVFGTIAALVGALPATGALTAVALRTPTAVRDGLRTGLVAACLLLAAGAGIAGLAIAVKGGDAADLIAAYRTGTAGQAGMTLVSVAFAPNVAVWAAAYLLGPGFAVGTDTVVRTTEVTAGVLPALPLTAGLPEGPLDGLGAALLAVPMAAGLWAGWLLARRRAREGLPADRESASASWLGVPAQRVPQHGPASRRWSALLAPAALAGPVAGLVLGLAALASAGSLGGGRLAQLGPTGWQVAVAATVLVGIGSVVGAATGRAVGER
ncbi:MAG TPA: DUF6350 family protein [Micromonosporaceae bacterium]|nr:DUF6350 family protein [Micromonosporaceae bacterium]